MQSGSIGAWHVAAGDSFAAGDVIAEIQTDKATMGFEAQDPGVVAKILVDVGSEVGCPFSFTTHQFNLCSFIFVFVIFVHV
jgi:pyruvate dehydrogenase E2 component (dihydrolipoamide acetyltransferase)